MRRLHEYCSRAAQSAPDRMAVIGESGCLTYGELDQLSNRIARLLIAAGCRNGDRVAILSGKSPLAIAAILGVLKADCIYVPMDKDSPPGRAARILRSAGPRIVVADDPSAKLVSQLILTGDGLQLAWLDRAVPSALSKAVAFTLNDVAEACPDPVRSTSSTSDPAYIMFTSGSTGVPKGVVIAHSNVARFVEWAVEYFELGATDRISGHTPLHFDLSVLDVFGALAAGAELHLVPPSLNIRPGEVPEFIRNHHLTQWFSVPAVLNLVMKFDALRGCDLPELRRVLWCGEALPLPALRYWMRQLPHVRFTNLYGPTETTVASAFYTVPALPPDEVTTLPIGTPCAGESLYVVNENMALMEPGQTGELCIAGDGVGLGYWSDSKLTATAFMTDPFRPDPHGRLYKTGDLARVEGGLVYFLGRRDTQVKSRGYRIELGEIESALQEIPQLQDAAVIATPSRGFDTLVICCAYAALPGVRLTPVQVRAELSRMLPAYMMPTRWMELDRMPRHTNGKKDLVRLKEMFTAYETAADGRDTL